jgi:dsRNA-specific ribonuclease
LKYHLDPAAWVHPGELNAMQNCVFLNEKLAKFSREVNVRFIVLLSPFDRTQGRIGGRKASRLT